jgi:hypothetical protein
LHEVGAVVSVAEIAGGLGAVEGLAGSAACRVIAEAGGLNADAGGAGSVRCTTLFLRQPSSFCSLPGLLDERCYIIVSRLVELGFDLP